MKARTNTLRNKPDKAKGLGKILFAVFKDRPNSPAVKRVERLLSLLVAADRYSQERRTLQSLFEGTKGQADALTWAHDYQASRRTYVRTLEEIEKALQRYRWRATVSQESDHGEFKYDLYCVANSKSGPLGDLEGALVAELLEMTKKPGELSRIRRCSECHDWFYAVTTHQHFCGDSCRRRHAAQSPDFKEKRRRYMKEKYRPLQKELHERSLKPQSKRSPKAKGKV